MRTGRKALRADWAELKMAKKKQKTDLLFPSLPPLDRYYVLPSFRSWENLRVNGEFVVMQGNGLGFLPVWGSLESFQEANPGLQPMIFTLGGGA